MDSKSDNDVIKNGSISERENRKDQVSSENMTCNGANPDMPPTYHSINNATNKDIPPPYSNKPENKKDIRIFPPQSNPRTSDIHVCKVESKAAKKQTEPGTEDDGTKGIKSCYSCMSSCLFTAASSLVGVAFAGLSIAKVGIGSSNLHDCDIECMIPVYLIVSGFVPIYFSKLLCHACNDDECSCWPLCWFFIGFSFCLAWLICGSVWIYPTHSTVFSEEFQTCKSTVKVGVCSKVDFDKYLLKFSYAMVSLDWIFLALLIGLFIRGVCRHKISLEN